VGGHPLPRYLVKVSGTLQDATKGSLKRNMVGDAFDQGVLNPLRRKFSAPPKQKIFLIGELRSTQFKELYRS